MNLPCLGIDIAKVKFNVCLLQLTGKLKHKVFPNSVTGFAQLHQWLEQQEVKQVHACLEATGTYGEALSLYLHQHGHTVSGVPFATVSLARLSTLSAWFIRLGILPELIEPGKPQQNGRHERMHRTLKAEATRPPAANCRTQQRTFNRFRHEFNDDRPHEALALETPATLYHSSPRSYPAKLPPLEYPTHFETRYVSHNGGIRWNCAWVNVSITCAGEKLLSKHHRVSTSYRKLNKCLTSRRPGIRFRQIPTRFPFLRAICNWPRSVCGVIVRTLRPKPAFEVIDCLSRKSK